MESAALVEAATLETAAQVEAARVAAALCHNCDELVEEFEAKVKQDSRIKLNREGGMEWFLGVRYSFNSETGEVTADQEACIDSTLFCTSTA